MKYIPVALILFAASLLTTSLPAADRIDMQDNYRAVGRENDIRVDAQLVGGDVIRAGTPIGVTYQIENLTDTAVAVAEKLCSASFDAETRTITVAVGSEIPMDGEMPVMATIAPGEKKTFTTATNLQGSALVSARSRRPVLQYLQIKVSVLRNLAPFVDLLKRQRDAYPAKRLPLTDEQFEQWLDSNDTIFLNELPVRFEARPGSMFDASSQRGARTGSR